MLRQQETRYFYINPERAKQILEDYQSFKRQYQEFKFEEQDFSDPKSPNALYTEIAKGMNQVSLLSLAPVQGGRGLKGRLKGLVKKVVQRIVRPIMNMTLAQQKEMNRHSVLLAQAVVALEARVAMLEHQLKLTNHAH